VIVIGIDQCGAKGRRFDQAKPLPLVILTRGGDGVWRCNLTQNGGGTRSKKPLVLESLDFDQIEALCQSEGAGSNALTSKLGPIVLAMDCVLGLPKSVHSGLIRAGHVNGKNFQQDLQNLMKKAFEHTSKCVADKKPGYGFQTSLDFFNHLLESSGPSDTEQKAPIRRVEELVSAHSVFKPYPFQKNIQTGTFRIWSDLGYNLSLGLKFDIWPFTALSGKNDQILICEAYPSYFWKHDIKHTSRKAQALLKCLKDGFDLPVAIDFEELSALGADHLDALVNALGVLRRIEALKQASSDLMEGSIVL
jgi:hypothetical protein